MPREQDKTSAHQNILFPKKKSSVIVITSERIKKNLTVFNPLNAS
jgi:hypothetical protein